jgi:ArsR family transcriptional regulator
VTGTILLHPVTAEVTLYIHKGIFRKYNIFTMTNISAIEQVAALLQTIGQESRLQILLAIGEGETCVCHLEAMLGLRQATLSQHLMALREAGVVTDRRAGRYIHYHLNDPRLLVVLRQAAEVQGVPLPKLSPSPDCDCPNCRKEKGQGDNGNRCEVRA